MTLATNTCRAGVAGLFLLLGSPARAQVPSAPPDVPKTKIEIFAARSGTTIVRGFTEVGMVPGSFSSIVAVEARELTDAANGRREYGIAIRVRQGERVRVSYVDLDEVDALLRGIDYVLAVRPTVTTLANFQADYRTRGDLRVSSYSSDGAVRASVESGTIVGTTAFLELPELAKVRSLVAAAVDLLTRAKSGASQAR